MDTTTALPTSAADLVAAEARGERHDYLLFYGHKPEADGSIGQGVLSQWWPARFSADGADFATAEHYMMWRKAKLFGDEEAAARVFEAGDPKAAKAVGRTVRGFDEATWQAHRFGIVTDAGVAKFGQDPALRAYLLSTGRKVLVEASPRDRVWGVGMGAGNENARIPARWRGLNLLGFALMRAREILAAE